MHDANGKELNIGDQVLIPARVSHMTPGEDYCNVTVTTCHVRRPDGRREDIAAINTGVLIRANDSDDDAHDAVGVAFDLA